jgi:hypothetical protein
VLEEKVGDRRGLLVGEDERLAAVDDDQALLRVDRRNEALGGLRALGRAVRRAVLAGLAAAFRLARLLLLSLLGGGGVAASSNF